MFQNKHVRFVGEKQFRQFGKITKNMRNAYEPFRLEFFQYAQSILMDIKEALFVAQQWEELTDAYVMRKKRKGLSTDIWEAYGDTLPKIRAGIDRNSLVVGIKNASGHPDRNRPSQKIAMWMEQGTEFMPARPLLGPMIERLEARLDREQVKMSYRLLYKIYARMPSGRITHEGFVPNPRFEGR